MAVQSAVEEVGARALELSKTDRASLVALIMKGLLPLKSDVSEAWLEEADRRDQEMNRNPGLGVSFEDAFRRARAILP